ncbi:hypothetical protein [Pseudarthrobacter enclensis]|uniref:Uncharacterized protein n=1 Tax=Pseudarthrobacter enclensis TaxID=993070 RepID=A0ABT9RTA7_9MICC|nr:hypothetical protein [Pseudarthrobacter enclensis]MDP9888297.1 hypothetical protein [Pseudarthrobacter enclensis]
MISIIISVMLVWMFFQVAWVGSRTLDRKMLKDVEAPADNVRKEQRSVFFTFVILGTGTMAFSYVVGIASSWSAEELQKIGSTENVERPYGISGSVLFSGSLFLFALFTMILFGAHFRSKAPMPAEILADIKAFDPMTGGASSSARLDQLKKGMSASRAQFRRRWQSNSLDRNFYSLFLHHSMQTPPRRAVLYRYATAWQWKKKTWIPFTAGSFALALGLLIEMVLFLFQSGATLIAVLVFVVLALLLAGSIVWLQVACATAELRFLAADIRLELGRFKSATARLAAFDTSAGANAEPSPVRAQRLLLVVGPLQIWR